MVFSKRGMAVTTLNCQATTDFLAWKHPENVISLGSQIIVNEAQEALLFENGVLLSTLPPGRHMVETGNIPGLEGIIQRAFNNTTPILVEVWFLNKAAAFDYKWGTQLQLRDNEHGLLVPLGARGSYALRINDPASFVMQMVLPNTSFKTEEVRRNMLPLVERNLKDYIAEEVVKRQADIFTIASELIEISAGVKQSLTSEMSRFGFELVDFYVQALDVVSDDPSFQAIKEALAQAGTLRVRAKAAGDVGNFYQMERSLDALNTAAGNEGGLAGTLLAGGLGIGIGSQAGLQMGQAINNATAIPNQSQETKNHDSPASSPEERTSSQQQPPQTKSQSSPVSSTEDPLARLQKLKTMLDAELITQEDYDMRKNDILSQI